MSCAESTCLPLFAANGFRTVPEQLEAISISCCVDVNRLTAGRALQGHDIDITTQELHDALVGGPSRGTESGASSHSWARVIS